ncbi:hypothetical protein PIB30_072767, partial [Stylosanthes scabra]|nr:hypothetical protein [Stylosanthes scabra]
LVTLFSHLEFMRRRVLCITNGTSQLLMQLKFMSSSASLKLCITLKPSTSSESKSEQMLLTTVKLLKGECLILFYRFKSCARQMVIFVVPVLHYGGRLERIWNGSLCYLDGKVKECDPVDIDFVSLKGLEDLCKGIGYLKFKAIYWQEPSAIEFEDGLHLIEGDSDINEMWEWEWACGGSGVGPSSGSGSAGGFGPTSGSGAGPSSGSGSGGGIGPASGSATGPGVDTTNLEPNLDDFSGCFEDEMPPDIGADIPEEDIPYDYASEGFNTPVASDDERVPGPAGPNFNEEARFGEVHLELKMQFASMKIFRNALKDVFIF